MVCNISDADKPSVADNFNNLSSVISQAITDSHSPLQAILKSFECIVPKLTDALNGLSSSTNVANINDFPALQMGVSGLKRRRRLETDYNDVVNDDPAPFSGKRKRFDGLPDSVLPKRSFKAASFRDQLVFRRNVVNTKKNLRLTITALD